MKKILSFLILITIICSANGQELKYSIGNWDPDSLGNHRIIIEVDKNSDAVFCSIPWRRKDLNPEGPGRKQISIQTLYRRQTP